MQTYARNPFRAQRARQGLALIPALIMLVALSTLVLCFLSSGVSGKRVAMQQDDDYRLRSAAESAGNLAAEKLWSAYLREQGGTAGSITSFRAFLDSRGFHDGAQPTDYLAQLQLPQTGGLDHERLDALSVSRRDNGNSSQLYFAIKTSTRRGEGYVQGGTARSVEVVYNVQPDNFDGFDYAILTKNVNCIFCHTKVDSAKRVFNHDAGLYDSFAKIKVGALSSLELRSDVRTGVNDSDADSLIAGTLYLNGLAYNQAGQQITQWNSQSAKSCTFDNQGHLIEDSSGNLTPNVFSDGGTQSGANLYTNYLEHQVDGPMPTEFPPPFPDDGGIDPLTHQHTSGGASNKHVDPNEFYAATQTATGMVSGGVITVVPAGQSISSDGAWSNAVTTSPTLTIGGTGSDGKPLITHGNVVITGTLDNPINISGTVAIDGDVVLQGVVKGQGVILAKGNLYVPGNLTYDDGRVYNPGDEPGSPTGPRTFGVAQDGSPNALGLAAGGNMLIGDYLDPSVFQNHSDTAIVDGTPNSSWNFTLAEISIFNRTEWTYTQATLPGPNGSTVANPLYQAGYVPRFYQFGPGDVIPIYNQGTGLYFDPISMTWKGPETALTWDMSKLSLLDPSDTSNPLLYDQSTGLPRASVLQATPTGGWLDDQVYENAIEAWKSTQTPGSPVMIDGLLYTNNAIFGIVHRSDEMDGQLIVNGSLVCADLGLLAPGKLSTGTQGTDANLPGSPFKIGLRLNYDERTKDMLNVENPNHVTMRRALTTPTASN